MSEHTGIRCKDPERLLRQVFLSNVTTVGSPLYEPGSLVPDQASIRRPTMDQLAPFLAVEQKTLPSGWIEILAPSNELSDYLNSADSNRLQSTDCRPNQLTTTQNSRNNQLHPGLHLDSTQNLPLANRIHSMRRLGRNHGPDLRFLLVGSLDVFDLTERRPQDHIPTTADVRSIDGRTLQCLWIPLHPLHTYIAPTENIIHDGSTLGRRGSTISFWQDAPLTHNWPSAI